jgi:hypothetical protein
MEKSCQVAKARILGAEAVIGNFAQLSQLSLDCFGFELTKRIHKRQRGRWGPKLLLPTSQARREQGQPVLSHIG